MLAFAPGNDNLTTPVIARLPVREAVAISPFEMKKNETTLLKKSRFASQTHFQTRLGFETEIATPDCSRSQARNDRKSSVAYPTIIYGKFLFPISSNNTYATSNISTICKYKKAKI